MAFLGTYKNMHGIKSQDPRGVSYPAACMAWFTSDGATLPLAIKIKADDGEIVSIKSIRVKYSEDKTLLDSPCWEYGCEAVIAGALRPFKLVFYQDSCTWIMVL